MMAEQLTRRGHDVVVIDRAPPGGGSTAASTAMLLWEIDRPLRELTELYGFERAARAYRASHDAVRGLQGLVRQLGLSCQTRDKPSLYLAAGDSTSALRDEHELRCRAGLPGDFLDHRALLETFEIARAGAILSAGSADADPVQLTHGLLDIAIRRGARLLQADAADFDPASHAVGVRLANGNTIEARHVVLATGYVMPDIVQARVQRTVSTWAIATTPQPDRLWRDGALIWEDKDNYLYARTTVDGRIIVGGEDDDAVIDPQARDALTPQKIATLRQRLAALWPRAAREIDFGWSGAFDVTDDGLPLIGPVPGATNIHAAYGYGGNGITFSFLAAQLIGLSLAGGSSPLFEDFALDRPRVTKA
ncbi:MAG: N-acetylglucosamine-1-phosphate uridyltransferase [Rhizobiales bacterium 62-47]|nr:MAG: N-acetylglucosamine-1-phosphate uridyltransferase [Rhizobiales bacterium 62-47]